MQIRRRIREDVNAGMEKQQREYILRKQMDSIRKELGEDEASVVEEYRTKIAEAGHARRTCASRPTRSSRASSAWARARPRRR